MAREKGSSRAGSAWERTFLGGGTPMSRTPSFGDSEALRQEERRDTDPMTAAEIQEALRGNDRALLPYQPTSTINPSRPRTKAAGYDERTQTLRIKFRNGEIYEYYNVPPSTWWQFQRAQSPGRFINSKINNYPYSRGLN